jgi:hypothetical protein
MKIASLAFLATSCMALANPIAIGQLEKRWERCVICVGDTSSTVSCAVGYKVTERSSIGFHFSVPIALPRDIDRDEDSIRKLTKARMEVAGDLIDPTKIEIYDDGSGLPDGVVWGRAYFHAPEISDQLFSIVVSYEQPTINGLVIYAPQFEGAKNPKNLKEFSISFIPQEGGILSLQSKHIAKHVALATRITIRPLHNETIIVKYNRSEQAGTYNP